jgi:thiol-disulfide isomerase/thioredoxin
LKDALMIERALIVLLIVLLGLAAFRLQQRSVFKRHVREGLQLEAYVPSKPAILYFTAPGCLPCRTIQEPALAELRERFRPGLQIITVDASRELDLVRAWGVLSVPTTFLIDSLGRPRRVNHGPVTASVLLEQFQALGEPLEGVRSLASADSALFKVQSHDTCEQAGQT